MAINNKFKQFRKIVHRRYWSLIAHRGTVTFTESNFHDVGKYCWGELRLKILSSVKIIMVGVGLVGFIGLFYIQRVTTLHNLPLHIPVSRVTSSLPLFGSGFQAFNEGHCLFPGFLAPQIQQLLQPRCFIQFANQSNTRHCSSRLISNKAASSRL
jgi:hypothetical protein